MIDTTGQVTSRTEPINILVVDDSPADRSAIEAVLDGPDRTVLTAATGEEALRLLLKEDVAAILLDINMPTMDGYATARLIRAREKCREVPIIFMTAFRHDELDIEKGYALGAVDYLFRPVAPYILRAKINCFVALAKSRAYGGEEPRTGRRKGDVPRVAEGRVLIVDDDPSLLEALPVCLQLRLPSIHIDLCESASEGLQRLRTFSYATIITDFKMPHMDGLAFLREAQALQPLVPVLLMTGYAERGLTAQGVKTGAFDCLRKPFDGDDVALAVTRALEAYRSRHRWTELQRILTPLVLHLTEFETLGLVLAGELDQPCRPGELPVEKLKGLMAQVLESIQGGAQLARRLGELDRM
ncbi:MAG: hypothetical protein NVSMB52_11060 [Chloroflexota bacterium]